MENKLGQEPAFPFRDDFESSEHVFNGMSKRFYAACAAMQGLCAVPEKGTFYTIEDFYEKTVLHAYKLADELLKQEQQ